MEQLMRSVEMPRDQCRTGQGGTPMPVGRYRTGTDKINYQRVQSVALDKAVLRQNRVLTGHEPALFRESFQLLRTQVLQRLKENHWNTLAVTSPRASEGKTLTAINLAISMAREVGYTVVLVDANLRRPSMLELLGLPEQPGLSDYLTDVLPIEELLMQPYYLEDLVVLPGGRAVENPTEMLNSPRMEQLVADMKSSTDKCIIIFDLPPVLATDEALAFSHQVDAALLVIEDGATQKEDVVRAGDLLGATNILGTVLNKARTANP